MAEERQEYGNFECEIVDLDKEGMAPSFRIKYDWEFLLYKPKLYRSSGFFSKAQAPVEHNRYEKLTTFVPFNGSVYLGSSASNPSHSLFQDYSTAWDSLNWRKRVMLKNLAGFETVNTHQWIGESPIEHRAHPSQIVVWRESPAWDVATSDISAGERIIMLRGHVARDYAFIIQQRLQTVADYTRNLIQGCENITEKHSQLKASDPEDLAEEHRQDGNDFAQTIRDRITDNPPTWPWLKT